MHEEGQALDRVRKGAAAGTAWTAGTGLRGLGLFLNHAFKLLLNGIRMFHRFHDWS